MPSLTDEQIERFRNLYRERFGKEISSKDALAKGIQLVRLFEIALRHRARGKSSVDTNHGISP